MSGEGTFHPRGEGKGPNMESKSTVEQSEPSQSGRSAYAGEVEVALMGTIKELLKEHRELIARLMNSGAAAAPPVDVGPSTDLIAQYRAIRRALALPDDELRPCDGTSRTFDPMPSA